MTKVMSAIADAVATSAGDVASFDWPGITIANLLVNDHGCLPWRMAAADYEAALAGVAPLVTELPSLVGPPVSASWDAELSSAMARAGRAVHEEMLLDVLLADLGAA